MKIYSLTGEGKKYVRIPQSSREEVLDYLYPDKTATLDELLMVDGDARSKLRKFGSRGRGYVEELSNV